MDTVVEIVSRGIEQLLGRAGGPLHLRLVIMPTVVTVLAIRAGLRDARRGEPAFLWAMLANQSERPRLIRSAVKDIGRIFVVACVLDSVYQLAVLRAFYPVQLVIVAVTCAIVPYALIRGPVTRLTRLLRRKQAGPLAGSAARRRSESEVQE